jgi:alkanesulfonate monooxygenase SsuD/methylene tetrahydromethanopterin reductase-like flavin-dependent oxidoreductase (luciferase family)
VHFGLVMECDYREGSTQEEAFRQAFEMADHAEDWGLDGIWLAERHFAAPKRPDDTATVAIPSIVSAPMILASALAARTTRLRVGIAVSVLPLNHPVRMAEEAATVDNISQGRFDFGVGRSGFMRAYEAYGIPYEESRDRFLESLEVIVRAWTNHRFSFEGEYYHFDDVCVMPKPYQQPHPPIRIAATTQDTFPQVGRMGYPIFGGLRGINVPKLAEYLEVYREAWRKAGHPGDGDVILRIPIYLAETMDQALSEPEESTMAQYRRLAETYARSAAAAGAVTSEDRTQRADTLSTISYEELLKDRVVYGTPDAVTERIGGIIEELGLSGVIAEMNVGGKVPQERVLNSLRLFGERVAPELRR